MNRDSIQFKLFGSYSVIIILSIFVSIYFYYGFNKASSYYELVNDIEISKDLSLEAQLMDKDFMIYGIYDESFYEKQSSPYVQQSHDLIDSLLNKMKAIQEHEGVRDPEVYKSLRNINELLLTYKSRSEMLMRKQLDMGFKDWGNVGLMRKYAHDLESFHMPIDDALVLQLRRHEKDFLLRKQMKYSDRLKKSVEDLKEHIVDSYQNQVDTSFTDTNTKMALATLAAYQFSFNKVVDASTFIGFNDDEGLMSELRTLRSSINEQFNDLESLIKDESSSILFWVAFFFIILIIIQIVSAVYFGFNYSNKLSSRIKKLSEALSKLSVGKEVEIEKVKFKDELSVAYESLNELKLRYDLAADYTLSIVHGEDLTKYKELFNSKNLSSGELGKGLFLLQKQLSDIKYEEEMRTWRTEGISKFNEMLRELSKDEVSLFDKLLSNLVNYIGVAQGAIFVLKNVEGEDPYLELKSIYAFDKKKYENRKISLQEGLIGQACIDQRMMYLTDIPSEYVNITSGLGEATPTSLMLVPLVYNNRVYGLIELASFNLLEDYHREFLKQLSFIIASTLADLEVQQSTKEMLLTLKEQAEMMKGQEQMMKDSMEQMMGMQEEFAKKEKAYKQEIESLKENKVSEEK